MRLAVAQSIGNIEGQCDGCSPGLIEMYRDYIEGRRELREINREFNARYTRAAAELVEGGCPGEQRCERHGLFRGMVKNSVQKVEKN